MRLRNFFRPRWLRNILPSDLTAVAKTKNARKLRIMATQNSDERVRLEAARRLNDIPLLKSLARTATRESVRLDAAIDVNDQPRLTAIALKAWDVHLGQKAVGKIDNRMLLRRVAGSAQQDAIRLAAALKMDDPALLRQVAQSSNHIDVHWQVARYLNDPCMLADIAMFKPGNIRLEPMRRMARKALMEQLDRCGQTGDHKTLLAVIESIANPTFKLEALVRLPAETTTGTLLAYIAAQDLRYIPKPLLEKMISCIQAGGWQVDLSVQRSPCAFCRGTGQLSLKCVSANDMWGDCDVFACPDCRGLGENPFYRADCTRSGSERVVFNLPL